MIEWLVILWLLYVPSALNLFYRILHNRNSYEKKINPSRVFHSPDLTFLIACKETSPIVQTGISSIHESCKKISYSRYSVKVVTDEVKTSISNADVIKVPDSFKSKAKYKARALQYALAHISDDTNTWIFHLDEESVVTEQCVRAILEYIEDGGKPIAEGPINYPTDLRNILTLFLEGERSVSCYYCVDQMKSAPIWLHGSNLLVNSKIEHEVGWEFGESIAEDQRFAYEAEKKFGKIFGWHGGVVFEKPAFTVSDALEQRKRWFYGSMQNLKHMTAKKRVMQYYYLLTWVIGFFAAIIAPLSWFQVLPVFESLRPFLIFALVFWFAQYQVGLHLNIRHNKMSKINRFKCHFLQFILCPLVGAISTLPAVLAIIDPPRSFNLVKKN